MVLRLRVCLAPEIPDGFRRVLLERLRGPLEHATHAFLLANAALQDGPDPEASICYLLDALDALDRDLSGLDTLLSQ